MTSDSFINLSKVKSILPSFPFRQATQGDGSQSFGKQTYHFKTISRSSTNLITTGSAEPKSDLSAGYTSSPLDSSLTTLPRSINVVLFGETGVGKSSVINLIARKEVAKVSSDVNGCTMQSTRYDIPFDDLNFCIFDTIGLEEPQMGVNGYLKAIEKAYELIVRLGAAGGIHLLLFCMRGGRITATTQSNYRLFCECLCNTKVPTALVFTGLEREVEMEDWWTRNKTHIEHYGIKSDGHACITAVQDDTPGEDLKYAESQKRIRELLKNCALKNEAFLPEPHTWFAKFGKGMRSFIEKHRNPKRRDVMKVLTNRCKLDPETARKIADMMEKGDTETKDGNQDEQAGNREGEGGSNSVVRADGKDESEVAEKNTVKDDASPNQLRDVKAEPRIDRTGGDESEAAKKNAAKDDAPRNVKVEPRIDGVGGKDESEVAKKYVAKDYAPSDPLGNVKVHPRIDAVGRKDESEATKKYVEKYYAPSDPLGNVKFHPRIDAVEGNDESEVAKKYVAKDYASSNPLGNAKVHPRINAVEVKDESEVAKKYVAKDYAPSNPLGNVKVHPRIDAVEVKDESEVAKKYVAKDYAPSDPLGNVKVHPRVDAVERKDETEAAKKYVEKDYAPSDPLGNVKVHPRVDAVEGKDESEVAKKYMAKDYAPSNPLGIVKVQPRIDAVEGRDENEAAKTYVAKDYAPSNPLGNVKAQPRIDAVEGKDSGQPKRYGSGKNQPLRTRVVEQVKQGDTKKRPNSSVSSRPRQVISPS